jgi:hypothetical protein
VRRFIAAALFFLCALGWGADPSLKGIWDITGVDVAGVSWNGSTLTFTDQTPSGAGFDVAGYF